MDRQVARAIAERAVETLVADQGSNTAFPFDAIWQYASQSIPSAQRPAMANYLVRRGYIERTGNVTTAVGALRASSATTEYRPGRHFRPPAEAGEETHSTADLLRAMEPLLARMGFAMTAVELANFYLAMLASPLVILTGVSGTGKSRLPRLFARLIAAQFRSICVQPQWSDNSDLFGYTPSLAPDTFAMGPFTRIALEAHSRRDELFIVLLDEMNLAPVEHYFSDFLSVVASRERVDRVVKTDALPLDLPRAPVGGDDPHAELRHLELPPNARVVGTANMDETTRSFSPKVLDRAFSIEFDRVDLASFPPTEEPGSGDEADLSQLRRRLVDVDNPVSIGEVYAANALMFETVAGELQELLAILEPAGIAFGYRTRDEILLYLWHWQHDELWDVMPPGVALDFCILQKILPKISGTGETLAEVLRALESWLRGTDGDAEAGQLAEEIGQRMPRPPCPRSARKVQRMLRRLEDEGATSYWVA